MAESYKKRGKKSIFKDLTFVKISFTIDLVDCLLAVF